MVKSRKLKMTKSRKSRMNKSRKMRKSMNRKRVGGSSNNITVNIYYHIGGYNKRITIDANATVQQLKVAYLNLVRDNPRPIFVRINFDFKLGRNTLDDENQKLSEAGVVDESVLHVI